MATWLQKPPISPTLRPKKQVLLPNDGAGRKALGQLGRCQLLTVAHQDASTSGTANNLQVVQTLSIKKWLTLQHRT